MPSYDYLCPHPDCLGEFEEYHSIKIKLEICPHCQAAGRGEQPIQRLISGGGNGRGIVHLTGQDLHDKIKADGQKMKQEIYSNERLLANVVGEAKFEQNERRRNRGGEDD